MVRSIVIIGWGQIADLLCEHPDVVGYVRQDLERIIDAKTGRIVGRVDPDFHVGVIGIGKSTYKERRSKQWLARGCKLGTLIHPTAYVSPKAQIGKGSVVMPLAFVDDKSRIGRCTIVGPQSALRVASVGNYCHLAIQVKVLPYSKIRDYVFVGSGSTILENIVVGQFSVVGAGSTVATNIPPRHKYIQEAYAGVTEIRSTYPMTHKEKVKMWRE